MQTLYRPWKPLLTRSCSLLLVMALTAWTLLAMPLAAWADDDDKPVPIDPQTAAAQNRIIGIVLTLVCLALIWYYVRRWQILRSGNQVHGTNPDQD